MKQTTKEIGRPKDSTGSFKRADWRGKKVDCKEWDKINS